MYARTLFDIVEYIYISVHYWIAIEETKIFKNALPDEIYIRMKQ